MNFIACPEKFALSMLIHCSATARAQVAWHEWPVDLVVEVAAHRARLIQREAIVLERGDLAKRLS